MFSVSQLLRAVERLAHLVRGVRDGVHEPVEARLLVRQRVAQPRPEVVHGGLEVGHLEPAEPVEGGLEVINGVVQQLLAVAEGGRRAWVVLEGVEHGGLAHSLLDPIGRHPQQGLGRRQGLDQRRHPAGGPKVLKRRIRVAYL